MAVKNIALKCHCKAVDGNNITFYHQRNTFSDSFIFCGAEQTVTVIVADTWRRPYKPNTFSEDGSIERLSKQNLGTYSVEHQHLLVSC